jgi:V8-like Glu-specific endopeptidase
MIVRNAASCLLVLVACFGPVACTSNNHHSGLNERSESGSRYTSVGVILKNGRQSCTGTFVDHGLMITAKHCFDFPVDKASVSVIFSENDLTDSGASNKISNRDVVDVIADDDSNDIAYILYRPEVTRQAGFLEPMNPESKHKPDAGLAALSVGFPDARNLGIGDRYRRVVSENCQTTDQQGNVQGYDGALLGTTCEGWFGNSGGPVFVMFHPRAGYEWIGVLTHTFENIDDTSNLSALKDDRFGRWASINYSPFYLAKQLNQMRARVAASPQSDQSSSAPVKGVVFGARVLENGSGNYGVTVQDVVVGGPAHKAGLRIGHVILSIDDVVMNSELSFANTIDAAASAGKTSVEVMVIGTTNKLTVFLGK